MATAAKRTNWFAIWTTTGVVAFLAIIIIFVLFINSMATAPAERPDSAGINQDTGAVVVGTGENEVDLYFDFYCPHCKEFEEAYGDTISDLLADDEITLNLHPVALAGLNAASGTDFSERAANTFYCIADVAPEAAYPFFTEMYAQTMVTEGFTDEQMQEYATEAGAPDLSSCMTDGTWGDLVSEQTQSIPPDSEGSQGTPTLVVNGERITLTGDPTADLSGNF